MSDQSRVSILQYQALVGEVKAVGLEPRGGLSPAPEEATALGCRWLLLLGAVGGSVWPRFSVSPEALDGQSHPMNRWSTRVISGLAERLGARAFFPFGGPPYQPFLRWAQTAEGLSPSPIGMLIHPKHGLWHAYRGALGFAAVPQDWKASPPGPSPCNGCAARPCLSTCPVGAFSGSGYDVALCRNHLASGAGRDCLEGGCLARRACPIGQDLAYDPEQAEFHMQAFLQSGLTE